MPASEDRESFCVGRASDDDVIEPRTEFYMPLTTDVFILAYDEYTFIIFVGDARSEEISFSSWSITCASRISDVFSSLFQMVFAILNLTGQFYAIYLLSVKCPI